MTDDEYAIVVSERAKQQLVACAAFLARVSTDAAMKLADDFEQAAGSLSLMPKRCPYLNNEYLPKDKYRFLLFDKRYMIIFQVTGTTVFIDYVADCRRDHEWLLN